jgi:hypothetical protein
MRSPLFDHVLAAMQGLSPAGAVECVSWHFARGHLTKDEVYDLLEWPRCADEPRTNAPGGAS